MVGQLPGGHVSGLVGLERESMQIKGVYNVTIGSCHKILEKEMMALDVTIDASS